MELEQIKILVTVIIIMIVVLVALITTFITYKKKKKNGLSFSQILNDNLIKYMELAEQTFDSLGMTSSKSGVMKLTDVLNKIKIDCLSNGVEYDDKVANEKVEELIHFSKTVNK